MTFELIQIMEHTINDHTKKEYFFFFGVILGYERSQHS